MVDKTLIREYLSSLKEDGELDYIFVLLLEAMNFRIITTPKESKGQSQYGKDIVAVGCDSEGTLHKWYFELKGFTDKDLSATNFNKDDGVRMSLLEAKDTIYKNFGISRFDKLPTKICLVHNGVIIPNFKPQFDGFVLQNFRDGEFEHWDIHRLTDNFSEHLFNEYLFSDAKHSYLFKRVLIFIEVLDYEFQDLILLIELIFQEYRQKNLNIQNENQRTFKKLFSTLRLIMMMLWQQAQKNDNLLPAKKAINLIILNTWAFMLSRNYEKKQKYKKVFFQLLNIQSNFYAYYFNKTLDIALYPNGLFSSAGFLFESIGYPLRAFEYLDDLMYFFSLKNAFLYDEDSLIQQQRVQKLTLMNLINNNSACNKPVLDSHLIPIHHLVSFFVNSIHIEKDEMQFVIKYLHDCFEQIIIRRRATKVFPYTSDDLSDLIHHSVTGIKKESFSDNGSLLIPVLLEYLAIFNGKNLYEEIIEFFKIQECDLQIAYPLFEEFPDFEELMFKKTLQNEYAVEMFYIIPSFSAFSDKLRSKQIERYNLRTQQEGYNFLITLAQSYYNNEPFPSDWRQWFGIIN
ncbi:hypothetical protein [Runella sp. SP2]|uniref:hypothetical protein n=1 Tax=Runella sp. SP2 TaxID=2268026 RepID=UPI000F08E035|nr:hypothetical protein [Runella sp. SP2]AYQ35172.1 hypothetical protein DTQ70_24730 [Runella sp. SP2]